MLWNSRVVILDEPTAALGVAQTAQVLELVRRLADNGLAVVLISHNMNDVFAVSDRIAALYLGRMVAQVKATDVTHSQVVELITAGRSGNLGLPARRRRMANRRTDDNGADAMTDRRATSREAAPALPEPLSSHVRAYLQPGPRRRDGRAAGRTRPARAVHGVHHRCGRSSSPPGNFANLLPQGAAVTVIAMGLIFVLLLGEIDLSAGFTSGVCAAVLAIAAGRLRPALVRRDCWPRF